MAGGSVRLLQAVWALHVLIAAGFFGWSVWTGGRDSQSRSASRRFEFCPHCGGAVAHAFHGGVALEAVRNSGKPSKHMRCPDCGVASVVIAEGVR
mgnify:CR=1 FL=1